MQYLKRLPLIGFMEYTKNVKGSVKKSFPTPGMCTLHDLSHGGGGGGGGEEELIKELSVETVTGVIQRYKSSLQDVVTVKKIKR